MALTALNTFQQMLAPVVRRQEDLSRVSFFSEINPIRLTTDDSRLLVYVERTVLCSDQRSDDF